MNFVLLSFLAVGVTIGRVFVTIILSIVTGWLLGYIAIKNRTFENVYISLSEVLESVPVISFFPVVLIFFVTDIGGYLGVELAVIFLVFTAVVWNIWMGIYQAFKTVPDNLREVTENLRLSFLERMSKLYIPFSIPRIAANLIPSFADAMFYITVSEVFSVGNSQFAVFGIGSLIYKYTSLGLYTQALYSLLILAIVTTGVTLGLREYAMYSVQRYGLDTESVNMAMRRGRFRIRYSAKLSNAIAPVTKVAKYVSKGRSKVEDFDEDRESTAKWGILGKIFAIGFLLAISYSVFTLVSSVPSSAWFSVVDSTPYDLILIGIDYLRVAIIALISLIIAIFVGYWVSLHHKVEMVLIPVIQSLASFPAPAYFPLLFGFTYPIFSRVFGGLTDEFYVLFLGFISTFYYVFYSYWMGVKNLPKEYWEVMDNLNLSWWDRLRKIVIPSAMPYLITGLTSTVNSAWGGLAIGEYWTNIYDGRTLQVHQGLMKELAIADSTGNLLLVGWLSVLFAIIVVVYSIVFTRKLMDLAREKYVAEEGIYAA
ncbi:ABC transporter permease subunit [Metallosphaera tengchongensis]|uniref:ABC transporter permease subunit n=1 Tax=Metallosphaera tengchongensis TaxID=1532350 RepID=A0A6N0NT85_9CREN|nr:ABC transporter permease subunit [Metallosphaera tengchongensis]QKQ99112.1 ABC transporter permease subunit [Metallosphaera tengchongensis]